MMNLRGRAEQRKKPLDDDCYKAKISTHEYGMSDNRKFCYGMFDMKDADERPLEKCRECGAFVENAEPMQKGGIE